MKKQTQFLAGFMAAAMALSTFCANGEVYAQDSTQTTSPSQAYVEQMGHGWNLGNSFDGFDADLSQDDSGETAWGNPKVTKELIDSVADKGYQSIRIPMTVYRRYTENASAGDGEYRYVIDEDWLRRYKEVVDWAVDDGLYVMINIHHDSWIWLKDWDGDLNSVEYEMYTDFWEQLADYFKDEPEQVCFETINEPTFSDTGDITAQKKLDLINQDAHDIIRSSGGNNKTRMIVMPSLVTKTDDTETTALSDFIASFNDPNIIATVHYYSEWVYSANLGKTGFDEALWDNYTPRNAADTMMNTLKDKFLNKGIGVIVGEYGLLGYDTSEGCLQEGEELKYYEYMNELARENNVCLIFWDNGSGINRTNYQWKKEDVGTMLEASMNGRSSYATGLDTLYFSSEATEDISIPLTLNDNSFSGIYGLTEDVDYTYDDKNAILTLKKDYVNNKFIAAEDYGTFDTLTFQFSSGADWHQYLVKCAPASASDSSVSGSRNEGITIPIAFHGNRVRRIMTYQASGKVGPNSGWWNYLKYDDAFHVGVNSITLTNTLFADSSVADGVTKAKVEFYDGSTIDLWLKIDGDTVTYDPSCSINVDEIGTTSDTICLYAGETEIPAQYLNVPAGASIYGTYINDDTIVKLEGWPASMTFDTKAHDAFTSAGIQIQYMDAEIYKNILLGIKDAPVVSASSIKAGETTQALVSNLSDDAAVSYSISDPAIASVDENGLITGKASGTTTLTATITQYGRTDQFHTDFTVNASDSTPDNVSNDTSGKDDSDPAPFKPAKPTDSDKSNKKPNVTADADQNKPDANTASAAQTPASPSTGDPASAAFYLFLGLAAVGITGFSYKRRTSFR